MNTLSKQLAQGPVLAPGVYDALSALAAEQAGFRPCTCPARPSPIRGWAVPTWG